MADMTQFTGADYKLKKHLMAIRENKFTVGHIFLFLCEDPPNASAAKEALEELSWEDQIKIWSCSTKDGGVWETWERDALKYGELQDSYQTWLRRIGL